MRFRRRSISPAQLRRFGTERGRAARKPPAPLQIGIQRRCAGRLALGVGAVRRGKRFRVEKGRERVLSRAAATSQNGARLGKTSRRTPLEETVRPCGAVPGARQSTRRARTFVLPAAPKDAPEYVVHDAQLRTHPVNGLCVAGTTRAVGARRLSTRHDASRQHLAERRGANAQAAYTTSHRSATRGRRARALPVCTAVLWAARGSHSDAACTGFSRVIHFNFGSSRV